MNTLSRFAFRLSILAGTAFPGLAYGQAMHAPPATLPADCAQIVNDLMNPQDPVPFESRVKSSTVFQNSFLCFVEELGPLKVQSTQATRAQLVSHLEAAGESSNRQAGAPSSAAGSTSAVSQPFDLLSLASEYGGITSSSNNGTFTIKSALDQLPRTIEERKPKDTCTPESGNWPKCFSSTALNILHQISVSTTFNTSTASKMVTATPVGAAQGTTQQITTTPKGSATPSFSGFTTKFTVINDKADGAGPWVKAVLAATDLKKSGSDFAQTVEHLGDTLETDERYKNFRDWQACTYNALNALKGSSEKLPAAVAHYYGQLYIVLVVNDPPPCDKNYGPVPEAAIPPDLSAAITAVENTLTNYQLRVDGLRKSIERPVLTLEYDYNQPQNQPTNSVFRLILSDNILKKKDDTNIWTLTGNIAGSIYNSTPSSSIPGAGRVRDIQAAFEADYSLPSFKPLGQTTLGGAYYFQYQSSPSILNVTPGQPISGITFVGLPSTATQVFTQKGNIDVAQIKWGLGTGKKLRFPLAFSYSNRTELISKPDWRGQFGISYDFTALTNNATQQ